MINAHTRWCIGRMSQRSCVAAAAVTLVVGWATPRALSFAPVDMVSRRTSVSKQQLRATTAFRASSLTSSSTPKVDMNKYNLPLDQALTEWSANIVPKSYMVDEGVYLGARDSRNNYADSLRFEVRRTAAPGEGLGIELLEIAGGREDGLGITVCSSVVQGGNAEDSGIIPGDSIVSIGVLGEFSEKDNISTECMGYDATVGAIRSLPDDWETLVVHVKRLRRKPKVSLKLKYPPSQGHPDEVIELFAGECLRRAMLARGVKLNDALSRRFDTGNSGDCGAEGTCATCVVNVQQGGHLLSPIGIQEKQILHKNPRWRFACKTVVGFGGREGNMTIQVNPRQW